MVLAEVLTTVAVDIDVAVGVVIVVANVVVDYVVAAVVAVVIAGIASAAAAAAIDVQASGVPNVLRQLKAGSCTIETCFSFFVWFLHHVAISVWRRHVAIVGKEGHTPSRHARHGRHWHTIVAPPWHPICRKREYTASRRPRQSWTNRWNRAALSLIQKRVYRRVLGHR